MGKCKYLHLDSIGSWHNTPCRRYLGSLPPFGYGGRQRRNRRRFCGESWHVPCFPTTLHMNDALAPNPLEKNMNCKTCTRIIALTLFAALALPLQLAAQNTVKRHHHHKYHHYQLVDPGTFGGADSSQLYPSENGSVNNSGVVVGSADTSTPDPTSTCFNGDCYISYGFKWQDGVLHKLRALPGFNSSTALAISNTGHVVGLSEHGIDPLTGGRALEAVSWGEDGSIRDLGSFGGNEGLAYSVNNRGEVVGVALNTIPDPYAWFFFTPVGATQSHAFRWTHSAGLQDLGTLGGTDSVAVYINDRGQIYGYSSTDYTVNQVTGLPTTHPFLWENGTMTDLGTLGGSLAGPFDGESVGGLNHRGDVIGTSYTAGDVTQHPFLWTKSGGMQDLGTLPGGTYGAAMWLNDAREVVGLSGTSDAIHAFLWRDGVMTDLKTVGNDPESQANSINSLGQVVGTSFDSNFNDLHGFLWEDGGSIVDLNTLVSPRSSVFVPSAIGINDRGEIAAKGVLPNGNQHNVLLIPCDEGHPGVEGCDYSMVDAPAVTQSPAPRYVLSGTQRPPQSRRSNRYHIPGYNQLAR
jgi:probable HAF family extracellular repeat protein